MFGNLVKSFRLEWSLDILKLGVQVREDFLYFGLKFINQCRLKAKFKLRHKIFCKFETSLKLCNLVGEIIKLLCRRFLFSLIVKLSGQIIDLVEDDFLGLREVLWFSVKKSKVVIIFNIKIALKCIIISFLYFQLSFRTLVAFLERVGRSKVVVSLGNAPIESIKVFFLEYSLRVNNLFLDHWQFVRFSRFIRIATDNKELRSYAWHSRKSPTAPE